MSNNHDGKCWKCLTELGSFYHMWWSCSKVKKFWINIHTVLQVILDIYFEFHPMYFLLGICPDNLPKTAREFFFYATTAARLLLSARWHQQTIPDEDDWIEKMKQLQATVTLSRLLTPHSDSNAQHSWDAFQSFAGSR